MINITFFNPSLNDVPVWFGHVLDVASIKDNYSFMASMFINVENTDFSSLLVFFPQMMMESRYYHWFQECVNKYKGISMSHVPLPPWESNHGTESNDFTFRN